MKNKTGRKSQRNTKRWKHGAVCLYCYDECLCSQTRQKSANDDPKDYRKMFDEPHDSILNSIITCSLLLWGTKYDTSSTFYWDQIKVSYLHFRHYIEIAATPEIYHRVQCLAAGKKLQNHRDKIINKTARQKRRCLQSQNLQCFDLI